MNNTTGTAGALFTITYDDSQAAVRRQEIEDLLARMEWRREGEEDYDWKWDDCHFCNGHHSMENTISAAVAAQYGKSEYVLAPSQHDDWCPFVRLRALIREQLL